MASMVEGDGSLGDEGGVCDGGHALFVPGRVCLFGEHSDWAATFMDRNSEILPGMCIVCGTEEGLFATASKLPQQEVHITCTDEAGTSSSVILPLDPKACVAEAKKGGYWSYMAGTVAVMLTAAGEVTKATQPELGGLKLLNHRTTLPQRKGLSSSAAACVLVVRAFSTVYGLGLSAADEMELAFRGEALTPSACGRMDQVCALGQVLTLMEFNAGSVSCRTLKVGSPLYFVIADLGADKDTVTILRDLQAAYPLPSNAVQEGVHALLGAENHRIVHAAVDAVAEGDLETLGGLMDQALQAMDVHGAAACPSQLAAPVLHEVLRNPSLKGMYMGAKGVGSNGDGCVQFLVQSPEAALALRSVLESELHLSVFQVTVPATET